MVFLSILDELTCILLAHVGRSKNHLFMAITVLVRIQIALYVNVLLPPGISHQLLLEIQALLQYLGLVLNHSPASRGITVTALFPSYFILVYSPILSISMSSFSWEILEHNNIE